MKIINCTPHDITIVRTDGSFITTIPKSGIVPRLKEIVTDAGNISIEEFIVPIRNKEFRECEGLPEKKDNTFLIVPALIASALLRSDLLVPNTIRNEKGQIIGCDSFAQINKEK